LALSSTAAGQEINGEYNGDQHQRQPVAPHDIILPKSPFMAMPGDRRALLTFS
jgi:hypothetical protein